MSDKNPIASGLAFFAKQRPTAQTTDEAIENLETVLDNLKNYRELPYYLDQLSVSADKNGSLALGYLRASPSFKELIDLANYLEYTDPIFIVLLHTAACLFLSPISLNQSITPYNEGVNSFLTTSLPKLLKLMLTPNLEYAPTSIIFKFIYATFQYDSKSVILGNLSVDFIKSSSHTVLFTSVASEVEKAKKKSNVRFLDEDQVRNIRINSYKESARSYIIKLYICLIKNYDTCLLTRRYLSLYTALVRAVWDPTLIPKTYPTLYPELLKACHNLIDLKLPISFKLDLFPLSILRTLYTLPDGEQLIYHACKANVIQPHQFAEALKDRLINPFGRDRNVTITLEMINLNPELLEVIIEYLPTFTNWKEGSYPTMLNFFAALLDKGYKNPELTSPLINRELLNIQSITNSKPLEAFCYWISICPISSYDYTQVPALLILICQYLNKHTPNDMYEEQDNTLAVEIVDESQTNSNIKLTHLFSAYFHLVHLLPNLPVQFNPSVMMLAPVWYSSFKSSQFKLLNKLLKSPEAILVYVKNSYICNYLLEAFLHEPSTICSILSRFEPYVSMPQEASFRELVWILSISSVDVSKGVESLIEAFSKWTLTTAKPARSVDIINSYPELFVSSLLVDFIFDLSRVKEVSESQQLLFGAIEALLVYKPQEANAISLSADQRGYFAKMLIQILEQSKTLCIESTSLLNLARRQLDPSVEANILYFKPAIHGKIALSSLAPKNVKTTKTTISQHTPSQDTEQEIISCLILKPVHPHFMSPESLDATFNLFIKHLNNEDVDSLTEMLRTVGFKLLSEAVYPLYNLPLMLYGSVNELYDEAALYIINKLTDLGIISSISDLQPDTDYDRFFFGIHALSAYSANNEHDRLLDIDNAIDVAVSSKGSLLYYNLPCTDRSLLPLHISVTSIRDGALLSSNPPDVSSFHTTDITLLAGLDWFNFITEKCKKYGLPSGAYYSATFLLAADDEFVRNIAINLFNFMSPHFPTLTERTLDNASDCIMNQSLYAIAWLDTNPNFHFMKSYINSRSFDGNIGPAYLQIAKGLALKSTDASKHDLLNLVRDLPASLVRCMVTTKDIDFAFKYGCLDYIISLFLQFRSDQAYSCIIQLLENPDITFRRHLFSRLVQTGYHARLKSTPLFKEVSKLLKEFAHDDSLTSKEKLLLEMLQ